LFRTLRLPNDWAEAHWLLNYDYGFIKRALPGFILKHFINYSNAEFIISFISSFFLTLFFILLLIISYRILKITNFSGSDILMTALVFSSPFVVMSGHINGYADNIILTVSIISIFLITKNKIFAASLLIAVTFFIHESILILGFPSILCLAYIKYLKENSENSVYKFIKKHLTLIILPLAAFLTIFINQLLINSKEVEANLITHLSEYSFIKEGRNTLVPEEITTSFFYFFETQSRKFFRRMVSYPTVYNSPTIFLLVLYIYKVIKKSGFNRKEFAAVLAVIILPLSLHLIAWDTSRIWTYPIITCFIFLWGLNELNFSFKIDESTLFYFLSGVVIICNIFFAIPLMDNEVERFSNLTKALIYLPPVIFLLYLVYKKNTTKTSA